MLDGLSASCDKSDRHRLFFYIKEKRDMKNTSAIAKHYERSDLGEAILGALKAAGKDVDHLTTEDLAPVDEFHTRGRPATVDLARLLSLNANERVLDLGCGIGGPSRYLAKTFGCRVVGVDLMPEFCRVAAMLAERTGLADRVEYRQGDALAVPFEDQSFDVVWSQNVVMNIADRDRLYGEICRVLKPDGRYAFADVVARSEGMPHFPVPWAREPSASFLLTAEATRTKLEAAGFRIDVFEDQTTVAIAQQKARANVPNSESALGVHIILGSDFPTMVKNTVRGFEEALIGLVHGVARRAL
jgi:ubiquinone/menaquinone biosynthesis C-methylase UbiE